MNLKDWCIEWVKVYKRLTLKSSTYDSYITYCGYINCDIDIVDVKSIDIQCIINKLIVRGCSYSTVKHALVILRGALRKAYVLHMIDDLSCLDNLELPKSSVRKIYSLSARDIDAVLASDSHFNYVFEFLLLSGLRVGELIALRWCDIDFCNKLMYVRNTDYKGKLQRVKTDNGERVIPLTGRMFDIVSDLALRPRSDRVFLNSRGTMIKYTTLRDAWLRVCKSSNITPCGLHVLRHTFARRSLRMGVPVNVVSAWLGHADISITLRIYDDIDIEDMKSAALLINTMYNKSSSSELLA